MEKQFTQRKWVAHTRSVHEDFRRAILRHVLLSRRMRAWGEGWQQKLVNGDLSSIQNKEQRNKKKRKGELKVAAGWMRYT